MASIKFRFTTECEMTLHGDSFEDAYLQFKDFMHGDQMVAHRALVNVFPPETMQLYFQLEESDETHEIPMFKGDYRQDIMQHCMSSELKLVPSAEERQDVWGSGWYPG